MTVYQITVLVGDSDTLGDATKKGERNMSDVVFRSRARAVIRLINDTTIVGDAVKFVTFGKLNNDFARLNRAARDSVEAHLQRLGFCSAIILDVNKDEGIIVYSRSAPRAYKMALGAILILADGHPEMEAMDILRADMMKELGCELLPVDDVLAELAAEQIVAKHVADGVEVIDETK